MAVTSGSIVEGIDVVGHVRDRELSVLVDLLLDSLFLQAAEEGLGDSVVPAVALPAHTRFETIRTAESAPRVAVVDARPSTRHSARARGEWWAKVLATRMYVR